LAGILKTVWDAHIVQGSIALDKNDPLAHPITCTLKSPDLAGRPIVLVDDVLNSGRTLIYAVNHLLDAGPASISAAVLIDRIHRSFPVRADFCGLSLSTSVKSHIAVDLQANKNAAYLVG
jgi:pyrimidine operon attenuation protein / uracil phosphoribosyltransferase